MKQSTLKKESSIPISKLKKKLLENVKFLVRTSGPCIAAGQGRKSCGGNMQASHIKSEGAHKNLFVDPDNIFPMCYVHHLMWWHKDVTEASRWFYKTYTNQAKYLDKNIKKHIDWTPQKIEVLLNACKDGLEAYRKAYKEIT